jgi:hypothetical protein
MPSIREYKNYMEELENGTSKSLDTALANLATQSHQRNRRSELWQVNLTKIKLRKILKENK